MLLFDIFCSHLKSRHPKTLDFLIIVLETYSNGPEEGVLLKGIGDYS